MVWIVVLLLAGVFLAALWFLPIQVRAKFNQEAWEARLQVHVKTLAVNLSGNINITKKANMMLEHMWKRWRAKGEPVKVPLQKTIRRLPRRKLMQVFRRPIRYLGRRTHVSHLEIRAEVGGDDAMESALLSGAYWAAVGTGLGMFSRLVHLEPQVPRIVVIPNYRGRLYRMQLDCILRLRLGHAIVTGVWVMRRLLKEKEVLAWVRDSLRRKGAQEHERTSD